MMLRSVLSLPTRAGVRFGSNNCFKMKPRSTKGTGKVKLISAVYYINDIHSFS